MTPAEQKAFDAMHKAPERFELLLIDGCEYTVPAPVAAELLRLHLENRGAIQEREAVCDLMDSKRKCMEELRDALIHHMEQTRPIQRSIDALAAAKAVPDKPTCTRGHCESAAFEIALKNSRSGARRVIEQMVEALENAEVFVDGVRQDLHSELIADWYPEGAHSSAAAMSSSMRVIGNRCADFDAAQAAIQSAQQWLKENK